MSEQDTKLRANYEQRRGTRLVINMDHHGRVNAWAVAKVKHADQGWHPGLTALLVYNHGFWQWKLDGKTAGVSVDRALTNTRFRSVPTALEWAERSKFMREVESLREWHERILIE